jgi:hypothetical protein
MLDCSEDEPNVFKFKNVCYKPESKIPIIEESAKLKIAEILVRTYNKKVIIEDIPELIREVKKEYGNLFYTQEIL